LLRGRTAADGRMKFHDPKINAYLYERKAAATVRTV